MTATIDNYDTKDAEDILRLNAANVPAVGTMDRAKLDALSAEADWFPVVRRGDAIVGFAILLTEGSAYSSPNYRWFSDRTASFYYVDRIAIADGERGEGLGRRIYAEACVRAAHAKRPVLCAEVNTIPPNPESQKFHQRFGFTEVARIRPYSEDEEVAMLECALPRDADAS